MANQQTLPTKSVLQSKRSWFNYGSMIALALTAVLADEQFKGAVISQFGFGGTIGIMIVGALVNQYLTQTSDYKPTFEKPKPKDNLDILDEKDPYEDEYGV